MFPSLPHRSSSSSGSCLRGRVGVHLSLATGHGDVHETASVLDSLLCAALGGLLLLLRLNLGSLRLDLTGTSEGTVNLTHVVELWELLDDLEVDWDALAQERI